MTVESQYQARDWLIVTLPLNIDIPTYETSLMNVTCGSGTHMAEHLERSGITPLYYDVEQRQAGLKKLYNISSVDRLSENFTTPDGHQISEGALVLRIKAVDFNNYEHKILVENVPVQ